MVRGRESVEFGVATATESVRVKPPAGRRLRAAARRVRSLRRRPPDLAAIGRSRYGALGT